MTNATYSDLAGVLARKREGRRGLQNLSMAEKIMRMEALRDRLSPFKAARQSQKPTNRHSRDNA
jgi:hypothetical protein